jgi:hypothetical protein
MMKNRNLVVTLRNSLKLAAGKKEAARKTAIVAALAVLAGITALALSESVTSPTSASQLSPAGLEAAATSAASLPPESMSATCFCKVSANGTEVAKPSKGGFVQPFQAEACRSYCRGQWDVNQQQRVNWAKLLPGACGNVTVIMEAALGTMSYQLVRGPEIEHGINGTHLVTTYSCPMGQQVTTSTAYPKQCILPGILYTNPAVGDGLGPQGFLWQSHHFYQTSGPASSATTCQ